MKASGQRSDRQSGTVVGREFAYPCLYVPPSVEQRIQGDIDITQGDMRRVETYHRLLVVAVVSQCRTGQREQVCSIL